METLEMRNSISEIKNLLRRIRQMDMIEERINNLWL